MKLANKVNYEFFHQVKKEFNRVIGEDDFTHAPIIRTINGLKLAGPNVLDVGCGSGALDFYLANNGFHVIGTDISKSAIDSCFKNSKRLGLAQQTKFIQTSAEKLELKHKFDLILLIEVIEHIKDDQKILKRLKSLLSKNGSMILSTPSTNAPLYKVGFLHKFDQRVGHLRRYSEQSLTTRLQAAGLQVIYIEKAEGFVRNFLYTSTIGGKILLRLVNRSRTFRKVTKILDSVALNSFGESDLIAVCKNP